jgi:nitric oxide reductase NorQ protein
MVQGIEPRRACEVAVAQAMTDDFEVVRALREVITSIFP